MRTLGLLALLACGTLLAKSPPFTFFFKHYHVETVSGRVLVWEPWAQSWEKAVVGMDLFESTLVQVRPSSTISLSLKASGGFQRLNADSATITLNRPTIVRLQEDFLRRVEMTSYFIPRLPDVVKKDEAALGSSPLFLSMKEAWERFAAVLVPRNSGKLSSLLGATPDNPAEMELAVRAKKLRLIYPRDRAILVTERLPIEVKVVWDKVPDPNARYELRIWLDDQPRGAPLAITSLDYYVTQIIREGNYLVQITTEDGRWQSRAHRLHIAYPLNERLAQLAGSDGTPHPPLPLLEPPSGFTYLARQLPLTVFFHWKRGTSPTDDFEAYELVMKSLEGKELFRRRVRGLTTQLRFSKPGEFRWHVEALAPGDGQIDRLLSDERIVRIAARPPDGPGSDLLSSLLASKTGLFYIEDGL